jgi:hypothetical protein
MIFSVKLQRLTAACVICLGILFLASLDAADWTLMGRRDGIEIYRRDMPGSPLVVFKGEGTIEAPVWKIASILLDTKRAPEWADSLKESRVVKRLGPSEYEEYNHLGMPLILKDRDFLSDVAIQVSNEQKTFSLAYKPTNDRDVPRTHYVRGEIEYGLFEVTSLEPGRRSRLRAEIQVDPKGAIPVWVVNFFQKSWPLNTFQGIRSQAAKPDIAMPSEFKEVLTPTLPF